MTFAVHDLLRVDAAALPGTCLDDAPAWVAPSLESAPWVVVRREHSGSGSGIAVGVRGQRRAERFGTRVAATDVRARIVPEALCVAATRARNRLAGAARSIAAYADERRLRWGPVGSFGFELASGSAATTPQSDLDLVVRAAGVARETLDALERICATCAATLGVNVDVELEFDCGGIALREYARARPCQRVLAKTPRGPELVPCP